MSKTPIVTVLMPVFNNAEFLPSAVNSILQQTFTDFEFLIINDGSTDKTSELLASITDPRIRVIHNQKNLGLPHSLHIGVELSQGKYIARMDGDDIALPKRLEKQVNFLEKHPEIGILGSYFWLMNQAGQKQAIKTVPTNALQIRWTSLLESPFGHPTVILRRDVLKKNNLNYSADFQAIEDYEFWTRILNYTSGANLQEPLIYYRIHNSSISIKYSEIQLKNHDGIAWRTIQEQLPEFSITLEQVSCLRELFIRKSNLIPNIDEKRLEFAKLYLDLFEAFAQKYSKFSKSELDELKRQVAFKAVLKVIRPPVVSDWYIILEQALRLSPSFGLSFFGYIYRKIRRYL